MSELPTSRQSPLLGLPGAVAGDGIDAGVAAHYGSFHGEQRTLESGEGFVDLSHRDVVRIKETDRLTWLHSLTSQHFTDLRAKQWTGALVLSPNGHVEHAFYGYDDGEAFVAHAEPGQAAALIEFLDGMRFMMRVEVSDVTADVAVTWRPRSRWSGAALRRRLWLRCEARKRRTSKPPHRPVRQLRARPARPAREVRRGRRPRMRPVGLRSAAHRPRRAPPRHRHRPPHHPERGRLDRPRGAPGQGLLPRSGDRGPRPHPGRPPRRLTLLHLDGSENRLPHGGAELKLGDKVVGFVGSSARHHELGPIALAMVKRNVALDAQLDADGLPAAQEVWSTPRLASTSAPSDRAAHAGASTPMPISTAASVIRRS